MHNQVAAEKLDEDASRYDEENGQGAVVEAANKITNMWIKMAQLLRSESTVSTD